MFRIPISIVRSHLLIIYLGKCSHVIIWLFYNAFSSGKVCEGKKMHASSFSKYIDIDGKTKSGNCSNRQLKKEARKFAFLNSQMSI